VNKIQMSCALIILSALLCIPANALALSDLDTKFSVQVHGRKRQLQCDFMTISNGKLKCTDGKLVEQIPLSRIKQLDVVYMGKDFNVSEVNEGDIKSLNAMSVKKKQTVAARKARQRKKRIASTDTDAPEIASVNPVRERLNKETHRDDYSVTSSAQNS